MNTRTLASITLLLLPACNALSHIPGAGGSRQESGAPSPLADIYTVKGATQSNYDTVAIRTADSSISILVNGVVLNRYEFQIYPGAITFEKHIEVAGGALVIYPRPAAPTGSSYSITSTLNKVEKSLY